MTFSSNPSEVRMRLDETAEMLALLQADSGFPIGGVHDRRQLLASIRVPGTFPAESDLPGLRQSLATIADIANFFSKLRNDDGRSPYPALDSLARDLFTFPHMVAAIDRVIDRHGEIKDNASPALADIRRSISAAAAAINSAMRRVISSAVREGYLEADFGNSAGRIRLRQDILHRAGRSGGSKQPTARTHHRGAPRNSAHIDSFGLHHAP